MESKFNLHDLFAKFIPGTLCLGGVPLGVIAALHPWTNPDTTPYDYSPLIASLSNSAVLVAFFCVPLAYVLGSIIFEFVSFVTRFTNRKKHRPSVTLIVKDSDKRLSREFCQALVDQAKVTSNYEFNEIEKDEVNASRVFKASRLFKVCHTYLFSTRRYVRCEMYEAFDGMHLSMMLVTSLVGLTIVVCLLFNWYNEGISNMLLGGVGSVTAIVCVGLSVLFWKSSCRYDGLFAEWVYRGFLIESQSSNPENGS